MLPTSSDDDINHYVYSYTSRQATMQYGWCDGSLTWYIEFPDGKTIYNRENATISGLEQFIDEKDFIETRMFCYAHYNFVNRVYNVTVKKNMKREYLKEFNSMNDMEEFKFHHKKTTLAEYANCDVSTNNVDFINEYMDLKYSYKELSKRFNIPISKVKNTIHTYKKMVKKELVK